MVDFKSSVVFDGDRVIKTYSPHHFYNFSAELLGYSTFPRFSPAFYEASWSDAGGTLVIERGTPITDFSRNESKKWAYDLWSMLSMIADAGYMHGDAAIWNVVVTSSGVRLIDWENMKPSSEAYDLTGVGNGQSWWGTDHTISPAYHWGVSFEYTPTHTAAKYDVQEVL